MPRTRGEELRRQDETLDSLSCNDLYILQKTQGYRFSIDAYLLASFVHEPEDARVLEIGTGSGVISILLASRKKLDVTGVDIQEDMVEMSNRSLVINGLDQTIDFHWCDIASFDDEPFDSVVSNPPYRPLSTGRINPAGDKAIARHELTLDLENLLKNSRRLLKPGGRFYVIYPAWRLADLLCCMREHRIEPKRLRMVHSFPGDRAQLVLVEGSSGGGCQLDVESPIYIYISKGMYSSEITNNVFRELDLPKSH